MTGHLGRAALAVCIFLSAALPLRAEVTAADGAVLQSALAAAERGDWDAAEAVAGSARDPVVREIVLWRRLARGEGSWSDYAAFVPGHLDWPDLDDIRREGERRMPEGLGLAELRRFFGTRAPLTGTGALRLAEALEASGDRVAAGDVLVAAWSGLAMTPSEFAAFTAAHPKTVAKWTPTRLDHMLWRGNADQAEMLLPLVDAGSAALARARIALRRDARGLDKLVEAVPQKLAGDPGLAYDRFLWRLKKDRDDEALALLLERSASAVSLGRPDLWAERRLSLAHRAMREGDARKAYRIAAQHGLRDGANFEELEWFAGWVALRKLGDAKTALRHFETFRAHVDTPISLGRAGYWLGRAHEALKDARKAQAAFAEGARWQTSFYGQLAAERAGIAPDPALAGPARGPDWRSAAFLRRSAGKAALLYHFAGEGGRVWQFLTALARAEGNVREVEAMAQMALDLGRPHVAVRIAKIAAGKGIVLMAPYYPVTELATLRAGVEPELALAIARQESELNPEAVSPVGARGLMQLMPATARKVSSSLGLDYSLGRLTTDWQYNAQLGQSYLAGLLADFGSMPLAAAGYNAGPNRVETWLAQYGDPRTGRVDMVDWIETIPFTETRNYVMRVMEALHVYRARIGGAVQPLRLSADLGRRA